MEIKTKSGFKCKVNENKIKDWRYVKESAHIAKCNDEMEVINGIEYLMQFLLGDEYDRLLDHLAKDGVVDSESFISEFREIAGYAGEQVKKSQASSG